MHHLKETAHHLLHPFQHHHDAKDMKDTDAAEYTELREDSANIPPNATHDTNAPSTVTDSVERPVLVEKHIEQPIVHEKHIEKPIVHEKHVEKKFVHEEHVNKEILHEKHVEQPIVHEKHVEQPILHEQHQQVEIVHEKHLEQPIIHEKHIEKPIVHEKHIEQPIIHEKHIEKPIIHEKHITKPVIHEKHIEQPIIHEKHIVKPIVHEVNVEAKTLVTHDTAPVAVEQRFEKERTQVDQQYRKEKTEVELKTEERPTQIERQFEKRDIVVERQTLPAKERIVEKVVEQLPPKVIVEQGAMAMENRVEHGTTSSSAPIVKVETGNALPAEVVKEFVEAPGCQANLAPIVDRTTATLPPEVVKENDRSLPPVWVTSFFQSARTRDQEAFRRETRRILTENHDEHFERLLRDMEPHVLKDDRPAWKKLLDKLAFWRKNKSEKDLEDSAEFWHNWDPTLFDRAWGTYYVPQDPAHARDWSHYH